MLTCIRVDLSEYQEEPEALIEYVSVSLQNAKMIRETVPADQLGQIEGGDDISVYAVDGPSVNSSRRMTIWYNKEMAAIESPKGSIWGDWDEEEELLLTEEFEEAQTVDGSPVHGRIAYNLLGLRGIYSSGNFFLFSDSESDT
ncbi:MAG: hypothetical protein ABSA86_02095 [Oryzomonas sp.]|jgi:hypothetical protein